MHPLGEREQGGRGGDEWGKEKKQKGVRGSERID